MAYSPRLRRLCWYYSFIYKHYTRSSPFARHPQPSSCVRPLLQEDAPPSNVDDGYTREYDVFISHATEDKDEVVRPLAHALVNSGLEVWYDEFELKIGDSLRRKIDIGLTKSRFGVVVLSRSFFGKGWANYELDGLVTKAITGEQVILPIWHDITKQELVDVQSIFGRQGCSYYRNPYDKGNR